MNRNTQRFYIAFFLLSTLLFACNKESEMIDRPISGSNQLFYTLVDGSLHTYNANSVTKALATKPVVGLQPSEQVISIDIRPATGQLYALSNQSRIYIINIESGMARAVSKEPFTPALSSASANINFNPVTDLIRLTGNQGQAQSLDPTTGKVIARPGNTNAHLQAIAYTNNAAGASNTAMYGIDIQGNKLYKQNTETESLQEVGSLGVKLNQVASFDINPDGTVAMVLSKNEEGKNVLYELNLATGAARLTGRFPGDINAIALAMPTNGVWYAINHQSFITITQAGNVATMITKPITGLPGNENVLTMDIRPFNGQLFALTSAHKLYTVNMASGQFTAAATLNAPLNGQNFEMDFNPVNDIIHLTGDAGQNVMITTQGAVTNNSAFSSSPTTAVSSTTTFIGLAYVNATTGTANPAYVIAHNPDALFGLSPNNTNNLITFINNTGFAVEKMAGFDIAVLGAGFQGFIVFSVAGVYSMYQVNLGSGAASALLELKVPINAFASGLRFW